MSVASPLPAVPAAIRETIGPGAKAAASAVPRTEPLAQLVSVNQDGSDGLTHLIEEESVDLGRTSGQLQFADDPYLAERHCRFFIADGEWVVQDLDSINGIYMRMHETEELRHGDRLLLGKQVLGFELLSDQERDLTPAMEYGVLIFGSPLRTPWCRLRQLTVAGVARDVYHVHRSKVTIGREDGDIIFPDDEFMSRKHLLITTVGGKAQAQDLGSSNGSYLRIRGRRALKHGEMIRVGDQLLRFEVR